jgi:hypothetical protein
MRPNPKALYYLQTAEGTPVRPGCPLLAGLPEQALALPLDEFGPLEAAQYDDRFYRYTLLAIRDSASVIAGPLR